MSIPPELLNLVRQPGVAPGRAVWKTAMLLFTSLPQIGVGGETCTPGGLRLAVYKTAAVATEPRRLLTRIPSSLGFRRSTYEMVGCHGIAPCSRRVRAGTSLSKVATLLAPRGWS